MDLHVYSFRFSLLTDSRLVQVPYVLVENSGRCNSNAEGEKVTYTLPIACSWKRVVDISAILAIAHEIGRQLMLLSHSSV